MIGVALLGAGGIGAIHAHNLSRHPDFDLRFVADVDLTRAQALCRRHGGAAVSSAEEALSHRDVEAVIIASSTSAHRDHVTLAAELGRALLCEKPVATSLDDAETCIAMAEQAGVVAATGFNRRLDAAFADLKQRIDAGDIGTVEMMRLVSRSDTPPPPESAAHSGGMIREKGAHFYDLACWLAGSEPVEVQAMGGCLIDPAFAAFDDVDTAVLTVRLASGALIGFDFGRRTTYGCDEMIEVFGSGGLMLADRQTVPGVSRLAGDAWSKPGLDASWRERFGATYVSELDAFAAAIQGHAPVHATLRDGLRAQAVAEAAITALKTGRTTAIEPVWAR